MSAVTLVTLAKESTHSLGVRLLNDLREVFGDADQLATETILQRLNELDEDLENISAIGEDTVMWGSDFPHPDGTWPDSKEILEPQLAGLSEETRRKVLCDNAAQLYGFEV